ncbi:MAG: DAK2 domain-containing protein [Lachnospiraceae bacterium]|nr:DAK2 domain-containing protein [Lachnospiraceae bacterium]
MKRIDAGMIQKMFLAGAKALEAKKEYINELNVFPVPDGDTGTNMTMTVMAAAKDVSLLEKPTIDTLGKAISGGSLRGARGNSGVILSQIFRGFVKAIRGNDEIQAELLGKAISQAADTAYKAVMKPKEGTILTVAAAGAEKAKELLEAGDIEDLAVFCDQVSQCMEEALLKTPDLLPVLKEAGVVDSGGEGLMTFIRGALDALNGRTADFSITVGGTTSVVRASTAGEADIKYGYCTEFIIMLERNADVVEGQLKEYLQKIGDCVVVVSDEDIVKVHVHTNDPGLAIQKALTYGSLTSMKIDNMREEHHEKLIKDAEKIANGEIEPVKREKTELPAKKYGFIAVCAGEGLKSVFQDLGVDHVIEGGQTMNPSTEDFLEAAGKVNAETVFILPNNGNVILAAEQAKALFTGKRLVVIPSKSIPQGIAAMISFSEEQEVTANEEAMKESMTMIKSGQVTYAVRDTTMDGKEIKQGNYMGLYGKSIVSVSGSIQTAARELVESMLDDESELVSLYYGEDVTEEAAEHLADILLEAHDELEIEVQYGGQPIYSYFISVE